MSTAVLPTHELNHAAAADRPSFPGHLVVLTNFLPPMTLAFYRELEQRVGKLTILVSTPVEANRTWAPAWGDLNVQVQRTLTLRRKWRHQAGFEDPIFVHVPLDTTRRLRALRPDAIVSCEMGARTLASARFARRTGTPLVVWAAYSEHTEQGRGWLRSKLRRWLVGRIDSFAVNGPSGMRYLASLGVDDQRMVRLPYTAVPAVFEKCPATRPADVARRFVYYGQLIPRKGVVPLVQSLATYAAARPTQTIDFLLIGSGPQGEELNNISLPANLRLERREQASHDELPALLSQSGILIYPTLADEWALAIPEAMSAGLPVLGSVYSQAADELCDEGVTGWRYRPDVPGELEAALDRALATSVEQLDVMRRQARERVAFITPEFAAESLVTAVQRACDHRQSTRPVPAGKEPPR